MADRKPPKEDDDDARLWESVARSVKPIAKRGIIPAQGPDAPEPQKKASKTPEDAPAKRPRIAIDDLRIGSGSGQSASSPSPARRSSDLSHGDAPGVDRRTAEKLRRGLMPIEATLDLHGYSQDSGRQALLGFLEAHRSAGRRCVLVITGKGLKDDWSVGVLRQAVPQWLNAEPFRKLILAYSYAQPHHGGSGAIYILLRRNRQKA